MRVLHLHSGNLYGGVETVLRTMARGRQWAPAVHPVFAFSFDGRIADELRRCGCEVHILGAARASRPFSVMSARAAIKRLSRKIPFQATVVHSPWSLALLAKAAPRPLIFCLHDVWRGRHWTERWARLTQPDLIIANSAFSARSARAGFRGVPFAVAHPPIERRVHNEDFSNRASLREQYGAPAGSQVILQAGRFEWLKGHDLLLRALAHLRDDPSWFLWIAGEPQRRSDFKLRDRLERTASSLGIRDRIAFIGHIADVPGLMRAADIYCQPNTSGEAFGLTYVEALQSGIPVVATPLGGAQEILASDWALLPDPQAESVAEELRRVLRDASLRKRLAERGPERAHMLCDPERQIQQFAHLVSTVVPVRMAA